jgi:hypothetical protein
MIRVPDKKLCAIVLFNSFMWNTRDYCLKVLDLFLEENPDVSEKETTSIERTPVTLPLSQLEKWVGVYYHPVRGSIRQISVKDDTLLYRANPLAPLSPEKFYMVEMPNVEMHFTLDTMTVISESEKVIYQKVEAVDLNTIDFSSYEGVYYAPELGQRWTLKAGTDHLTVTRWKYPSSRMNPIFKDAFNDDWLPIMDYPINYTVLFDRDEKEKITGFKVSGNGVRHLRFERIS